METWYHMAVGDPYQGGSADDNQEQHHQDGNTR